ncbi:MAG: Dabb family protein, partial [Deltaproteobacteria bacterium]|nr:Dabb family protein [Deltaproteobacteria bacterium]
MITHVVLFKLKDRSEAAVEITRQVLLAMRGHIPELLDIEVGAD